MRLRLIAVAVAVATSRLSPSSCPSAGWCTSSPTTGRSPRPPATPSWSGCRSPPPEERLRPSSSLADRGTIGGNDSPWSSTTARTLAPSCVPARRWTRRCRRSPAVEEVDGGIAVYAPTVGAEGEPVVVRVFVAEAELDRGVRTAWLVLGLLGLGLVVISVAFADRLARSFVRPIEDLSDAGEQPRRRRADHQGRARPGRPRSGRWAPSSTIWPSRVARSAGVGTGDGGRPLPPPAHANGGAAPGRRAARRRRRPGAGPRRPLRDGTGGRLRDPRGSPAGAYRAGNDEDLAAGGDRASGVLGGARRGAGQTGVHRLDDGPLPVSAPTADLEAAVDALIGNVFAHTPEGTPYTITCSSTAESVRLIVDDGGAGFGPEALERGRSGGGSTGLGSTSLDAPQRRPEGVHGRAEPAGRGEGRAGDAPGRQPVGTEQGGRGHGLDRPGIPARVGSVVVAAAPATVAIVVVATVVIATVVIATVVVATVVVERRAGDVPGRRAGDVVVERRAGDVADRRAGRVAVGGARSAPGRSWWWRRRPCGSAPSSRPPVLELGLEVDPRCSPCGTRLRSPRRCGLDRVAPATGRGHRYHREAGRSAEGDGPGPACRHRGHCPRSPGTAEPGVWVVSTVSTASGAEGPDEPAHAPPTARSRLAPMAEWDQFFMVSAPSGCGYVCR